MYFLYKSHWCSFLALAFLFWGICFMRTCYARTKIKDRSQFYTEEYIDGQLFAHRLEYREGICKEEWKIEGREVDAKTYEERILEAEKSERQRERQKEEQEKYAQHLFSMQAQHTLFKKLLHAQVQFFKHDIALFERCHLQPYFAYANLTFPNLEAYTAFLIGPLAQAQKLLSEQNDTENNSELQEAYDQLETMQDKWKVFVRTTLAQAIEKCNDTKMLKELLQAVT